MGTWFSKDLGDGIVAATPSERIEQAFLPLFSAAGNPVDMAVFTRHTSEGGLHCRVTAFFSPAAAEVARLSGAAPCERPLRQGMDLLVGDTECWSALFPEREL